MNPPTGTFLSGTFLSGNDPANEGPERIHRLVQFAHEGYTAERLALVFYAETKSIFASNPAHAPIHIIFKNMIELLEAMEEARAVIND